MMKSLSSSTMAFQQETKSSIKNLEQQVTQLATSMNKLESEGKLPTQTIQNPKHNVCAISLKGEMQYEAPRML